MMMMMMMMMIIIIIIIIINVIPTLEVLFNFDNMFSGCNIKK